MVHKQNIPVYLTENATNNTQALLKGKTSQTNNTVKVTSQELPFVFPQNPKILILLLSLSLWSYLKQQEEKCRRNIPRHVFF